MTLLSGKTPTAVEFAAAVSDAFGDTIRDAAGKDGRLSLSEAKKISGRSGPGFVVGDNAVNWLSFSGQKSVSAEKLVGKIHDYAAREAEKVAGPNGRVSLIEARGLPKDLRAEFFFLRGKGVPAHKSDAELRVEARAAVAEGLEPFTLTEVTGVPSAVFGLPHFANAVPFPGDPHAQAHVYVGRDDVVYASIGASSSSPNLHRVGWYKVGALGA